MQLAFAASGQELITRLQSGSIYQWSIAGEARKKIGETKDLFAFSEDSRMMIINNEQQEVKLIDLDTGQERLLTKGPFEHAAFSRHGDRVALAGEATNVEVWNVEEMRRLQVLTPGLPVRNGLAISPHGRFVALAEGTYSNADGHQTRLELWDVAQRRIHWEKDGRDHGMIYGMWRTQFSPDGLLLATTLQQDKKSGLRVWNVETGREVFRTNNFESYWVRALAFSSDRRHLVSGDELGNLRVWEMSSGELVYEKNEELVVQAVTVSESGDRIACGLWDSTIHVVELQ